MTDTSEFEVKLLLEKNEIIGKLKDINASILNEMTYIDNKKVIDYYNQVDMIIFAIDAEYEDVRKRGQR